MKYIRKYTRFWKITASKFGTGPAVFEGRGKPITSTPVLILSISKGGKAKST